MSSSAPGIYSLGPSFKINYSNCCPCSFQGTFFSERKNLLNYYFWKLKNPNAALFFKPYLSAFCAHAIVHFYVCNHLCFAPAPPQSFTDCAVQYLFYCFIQSDLATHCLPLPQPRVSNSPRVFLQYSLRDMTDSCCKTRLG